MKNYIESITSTVCLSVGLYDLAAKMDTVSNSNEVVSQKSTENAFPTAWPTLVDPTR